MGMTIGQLQEWVKQDWEQNSKIKPDLATQLLFAMEEFGEVAEAIRKKTFRWATAEDSDVGWFKLKPLLVFYKSTTLVTP